jgi:hypothetical protein
MSSHIQKYVRQETDICSIYMNESSLLSNLLVLISYVFVTNF